MLNPTTVPNASTDEAPLIETRDLTKRYGAASSPSTR